MVLLFPTENKEKCQIKLKYIEIDLQKVREREIVNPFRERKHEGEAVMKNNLRIRVKKMI
jgi:hypothetical protein